MPLKDQTTDSGHLKIMECTMDGREFLIADLQATGLANPAQRPLHHVSHFSQAAAVRHAWRCQMVLDATFAQTAAIARCAIGPITVHPVGMASRTPAPLTDRRDLIEQRHRLRRVVTLNAGDAQGQRRAFAIGQHMPFRAFFGPICGISSSQRPPKTARMLWLSTTTLDQSMPFFCPTR